MKMIQNSKVPVRYLILLLMIQNLVKVMGKKPEGAIVMDKQKLENDWRRTLQSEIGIEIVIIKKAITMDLEVKTRKVIEIKEKQLIDMPNRMV